MARKYSSKKRQNKIEPSEMTLTFATPSTSANRSYIDLSQVASLVNRRFYRQGINWAVAGFKFSSLKAGTVNVFRLPNTWVMSNSWEKSFRAYMRMNKEALEENESVRPRFLDFKVFADAQHHAAGRAANLLPRAASGLPALAGEWEMSKAIIPFGPSSPANTNEVEFIATGVSYPGAGASGLDAVSLIEGYAASRGLPEINDPNVPDDSSDASGSTPENWITAMFNEGTDQDSEVLADMLVQNNKAPYPFENDGVSVDTMYPGGANQLAGLVWHDLVTIYEANAVNGIGIQRAKGGNFPCGLICIDHTPAEPANLVIQIDHVPGNHRGYLCEPMTEM
jgi:hypothetical protein